ncbi:hypothetical protein AURDEDRAFT_176326 [Auricularia subglabra TFB-10046 SS5]|nr:hypothetical protein AURDEDRAFT_176326 [Auricularia subglabra TFB-10046 SS5]
MYSSLVQWEKGTFTQVKFTEARFHGEYLDMLEDVRTHAKCNPELYRKLCRDLYKAGIAHAGVVIQTRVRSGLKAADFERAGLVDAMDSDDDDTEDDKDPETGASEAQQDSANDAVGQELAVNADTTHQDVEPPINDITSWFRQARDEREADDDGIGNSTRRLSKRKQAALDSDDEDIGAVPLHHKRQKATHLPDADDEDEEAEEFESEGEQDELNERDQKVLGCRNPKDLVLRNPVLMDNLTSVNRARKY